MLRQYKAIKAEHPECIVFFRLGDFYEMFFEDAKIGARVLDLVLTSRGTTPANRIPMCGIPYHSAENYIAKLIKAGHKVAICEQMEDPALAKGIVKRDIIRIITAGTYLDEHTHDARYLLAMHFNGKNLGVAFCDPTQGRIETNEYSSDIKRITDLLLKLPIHECLFPESQKDQITEIFKHPAVKFKNISLSPCADWYFNPELARKSLCEHFSVHNLSGFGISDSPLAIATSGALLEYLKLMNKQPLEHIDKIALYSDDEYAYISPAAHRGLELDSLIQHLDHTLTALGKRKFRFWLTHPLKNIGQIQKRQEAIVLLKNDSPTTKNLKNLLDRIPDIEKNISRLSCGYVHPKDLMAIRNTLSLLPTIKNLLAPLAKTNNLFALEDIPQLRKYLENTINPDIPLSHSEGKVINKGINQKLDELRDLQENGRQWLAKLQQEEIKRTGINSLKIGFNKIFGYYIEITNTHLKNAPEDYIRKQTLVNAERFITPQLKSYEEKILTAQEEIIKIENQIVQEARQAILKDSVALHQFCETIAAIDVIYSLSTIAQWPGYILPAVTDSSILHIKEGRHPVVEKTVPEGFIPNDTKLDCDENHLIILTGPNMAGKSTYIRQTALLTILAQTGSFIPAQAAEIGFVDKIFTRIGAHDDILRGQSTFMVEMNETADILNNLSKRSLLILDEIGRGTSTYDGLSLAWALAEHLAQSKVRTLFATHFHELTALADEHNGVQNYNVAVKEWKDKIVFLHKIVPGSTDDSYGIYVAKLAGIPPAVISRAKQILTQLELKSDIKENLRANFTQESQIDLFSNKPNSVSEEIKSTIAAMDINNLTPLEALGQLQKLKEKIENE